MVKRLFAKKFYLMFEVKKKLILSTKERTYQKEHNNQVKSFSYEAIVFCAVRTRAGNLCTREYSRLFVALFSLQTTHKLYTLYTHNTWVVWSKTITKTKISQKRLIASTQVPSSNHYGKLPRHLFALFFGRAWGQMGQKCQ